ncbi:fumarylacetoacetase [Piscinibacter sp.]|uniref:fumarylacetoacetase n=1 Tax=Piscinibacter sp. TaxID=1903157 RepID=UPI0039E72933
MSALDATHDPALRSWVESANDAASDFPVQNLPFARVRRSGSDEPWRIAVAIGDQALDLRLAREQGGWGRVATAWLAPLAEGELAAFMALGPGARRGLRAVLSAALREDSERRAALASCLVPQAALDHALPCRIGDYTDFYTGIHHATTVGKLFRPDNPLLPNYRWVPIGYHGRASSIVIDGTPVRRPLGQLKGPDDAVPRLAPTQRLDHELELGFLIGAGNAQGEPIPIADAEEHWFGTVLLNDWSARDVQAWEYQPLGPFLAKNFASTISAWVVTPEALAPFRVPFERPAGDPQPLPYLDSPANRAGGAIDIVLEVGLQTPRMREAGVPHQRLMQSNFRDSYWTLAQLIAHHTVGGCNLGAGDLLGSGTQSGPAAGQGGSLLELTEGGRRPITLANGETRTFLQDGDSIELRAHCERAGARRIGFGRCEGHVLTAVKAP